MASMRRAQQAIDDLGRSVSKITDSTAQTSRNKGGKTLPGVGSKTLPGLGPQKGGNGLVSGILGGTAPEIQALGRGTAEAFRTIQSSVKTFVDKTIGDVEKLNRSVQKLQGNLGSIGGGGGKGGGSGGGGVGGDEPSLPWNIGRQWRQGSPFHRFTDGVNGMGPGIRNYVGSQATRMAQFAGLPPQAAQGIGGFARNHAFGMGVGMAAVGAYEFGARKFEYERGNQIAYGLNQPFEGLSRSAAVAEIGQRTYGAARGGNISYLYAQQKALGNKSIRSSINNAVLQREAIELALGHGPSLRGVKNQIGEKISGFAGKTYGQLMGYLSGQELPGGADARSSFELKLQQLLMDKEPELAGKYLNAIGDTQKLLDPQLMGAMDAQYQGALSNTQIGRSIGMSAGSIYRDKKTGIRYDALQRHSAQLLAKGWTTGDEAAGRSQLLGAGFGYNRAVGPISLRSAEIAGLSNSMGMTRTGGILGGSVEAAKRFFYNTVQGSVGRRGLDVAVGNQFFSSQGDSMLASGNYGAGNAASNYMGLAAGLIGGGVGAPYDVANQQRNMSLLMTGNAANAGFGGPSSIAALYGGTSTFNAISSAGGFSSASQALNRMPPELLASISRGADIPDWAASAGVTPEMVKNYLGRQNQAPAYAIVDSTVTGDAAKTLASFRASGSDFVKFAESQTKGMTGIAKARKVRGLATQLGGINYVQGLATSAEAGAGTYLSQLAQSSEFAPMLNGSGAWAAAATGLTATALNSQKDGQISEAKTVGENNELMDRQYKTVQGQRDAGRGNIAASKEAGFEGNVGAVSAQLAILAGNLAKLNEKFGKIEKVR